MFNAKCAPSLQIPQSDNPTMGIKMKPELTQDYLKELLSYYPEYGMFTWNVARSNRIKVGDIAGCYEKGVGYIIIRIDCVNHRAHRLAWLYIYGYMPDKFVDHIDLDKSNNKLRNLRLVDSVQNNMNMPTRSDNTSGYRGVHWNKQCNKWQAIIQKNGVIKHLGLFSSAEDAALAYRTASLELFGEYSTFHKDAER